MKPASSFTLENHIYYFSKFVIVFNNYKYDWRGKKQQKVWNFYTNYSIKSYVIVSCISNNINISETHYPITTIYQS